MKPLVLIALCALLPRHAAAAPIVWDAFGDVTLSVPGTLNPAHQPPPVGTPWTLQFTYDPDLAVQTPASAPGTPCSMAPISSGSFTLGGTSYSVGGGLAFTNSQLPGTNCNFGPGFSNTNAGAVEFFMAPQPVVDDPWGVSDAPFYLLASYTDLIYQDGAFPTIPTYAFPGLLQWRTDFFTFEGSFSPQAVIDAPAPVPEPATVVLVGLGLGLARRMRPSLTKG